MLSNIDKSNIMDAKVPYLDKYDNLKCLNAVTDIMESDRHKYAFVDIEKYGISELYGSPIMSEDEESLTIKRDTGKLYCKEGAHYLKKYPVLTEIYELAEKAKASKK